MTALSASAVGWTAPELAADPGWVWRADGALAKGINNLMDWAGERDDPEEALARLGWAPVEDRSGASLRRWCAPLMAQLAHGRGVVRVTGLGGLGERELRLLFLAMGLVFGQPDRTYGVLYEVQDSGQSHLDRPIPISQTCAATGMHTDSSRRAIHPRWVGLACIQPAASGGLSAVASVRAIQAHLLRTDPAMLARLRRPYIRDVVTPGGDRDRAAIQANAFPILAGPPADPILRYMRHWIETGHQRAGQPLDPQVLADFDQLDAALNDPLFRHAFSLKRGDLLFLDNHRIVHGRTAYGEDPARPRRMLRLWLNPAL
jgi:hypothetical protein